MEEPREETEREPLLFGRTPAKGARVASTMLLVLVTVGGGSGTGVSFIISLPERARIFIDCRHPLHPCNVGRTERRKERRSKKANELEEGGRKRERKRMERVMIYGRAVEHVARFTPSYNLCYYCLRGRNLSLCRSLNVYSCRASDACGRALGNTPVPFSAGINRRGLQKNVALASHRELGVSTRNFILI